MKQLSEVTVKRKNTLLAKILSSKREWELGYVIYITLGGSDIFDACTVGISGPGF